METKGTRRLETVGMVQARLERLLHEAQKKVDILSRDLARSQEEVYRLGVREKEWQARFDRLLQVMDFPVRQKRLE